MEWKLKRIALLSLFFISVVEFFLEHGRIDLVLMTSTAALLLWSAVYSLRRSHTTRKRGSQVAAKVEQMGAPRGR